MFFSVPVLVFQSDPSHTEMMKSHGHLEVVYKIACNSLLLSSYSSQNLSSFLLERSSKNIEQLIDIRYHRFFPGCTYWKDEAGVHTRHLAHLPLYKLLSYTSLMNYYSHQSLKSFQKLIFKKNLGRKLGV